MLCGMPKKMITLLGQLTDSPLARPCDEPWERMIGDDRVRHCGHCARDVFHVSAMSELEAELRLLNAGDAAPCIRYARRGDGSVVHAAPPRMRPQPSATRSLVAATAIGVTLSAAAAHADDQASAPAQCVPYAQPAAAAPSPAAAPAPPAKNAPPLQSEAVAPAPSPAAPPVPMPLAGAPPMPQRRPDYGTLILKSKVARDVTIVSIALKAPLASYLLTPGSFVLDVRDPDGKHRKVPFKIQKDKPTMVDLDKR